ncbi:MAG TPA: peptidylprolyl isomerase, partial [Candidatus Saccharimonadaceae bacterium]|nr:peptidylprolyl isomerase [Candidatus Saccharimonadaceae bacterium]
MLKQVLMGATALALTMGVVPAGAATAPAAKSAGKKPAAGKAAAMSTETGPQVAVLETVQGRIVIKFHEADAPKTSANFKKLVREHFYDGTYFHRVIPGFMIQGGDPNTKTGDTYSWGTGGSGQNVKAEFSAVPHKRGIVSMARSNSPDSASSQFFIVVKD